MAVVLLHGFTASAQQTIEQTVKSVLANKSVVIVGQSTQNDGLDDGTMGYCRFTEFTVPEKKNDVIERLMNLFEDYKQKAYYSFVKYPDFTNSVYETMNFSYGAHNECAVTLGTYKSHTYYGLCFRDRGDDAHRHAHCLVWFKDGKKYHCYYYHIYGMDPSYSQSNGSGESSKPSSKQTTVSTRTYTDGNMVVTQTYDADGNVVRVQTAPQTSEMEIKTDTDFMLQFGNMRVAFLNAIKDADAKILQTGLVVKIVRLCKENGKLLTANERSTCVNSLNEMSNTLRKTNPDSFMEGMLNEARNALAK